MNLKQAVSKSKILRFFQMYNTTILDYAHHSRAYAFFINCNRIFKSAITYYQDSKIIKFVRRISIQMKTKEFGFFIVLVVIFNTLIMLISGNEIDIFSIFGRLFLFGIGVYYILKNKAKEDII